jgi:hypothetical protein
MKRSALARKTPMARGLTGMLAVSSRQMSARPSKLPPVHKAPKKRSNLKAKERAVSPAEKILWSRMAEEVGCIACLIDGHPNTYVSIHHIDGRTKPDCHNEVLPLCAPHHQQDDSDKMCRIAVHPNKARFEARYGSQYELLAQVQEKLGIQL